MAHASYKSTLIAYISRQLPGQSEPTWMTYSFPIKDYPDLGGSPELLETTTCTDDQDTHINGIQNLDALSFTLNYALGTYRSVVTWKDELWWEVRMEASTGSNSFETIGSFYFKGSPSIYVSGKGVNEVREMVITIASTTPITTDKPSELP